MAPSSPSARLASLFDALADPTRLRLLNLMAGREVCVCYFVQILGQGQSKISRHLAYLRRAGIVAVRREGRWMHYRLVRPTDNAVDSILDRLHALFAVNKQMRADRAKLDRACCAPQTVAVPVGAPPPSPVLDSRKA